MFYHNQLIFQCLQADGLNDHLRGISLVVCTGVKFSCRSWQGCVLIGWFYLSRRPKIMSEIPNIL